MLTPGPYGKGPSLTNLQSFRAPASALERTVLLTPSAYMGRSALLVPRTTVDVNLVTILRAF